MIELTEFVAELKQGMIFRYVGDASERKYYEGHDEDRLAYDEVEVRLGDGTDNNPVRWVNYRNWVGTKEVFGIPVTRKTHSEQYIRSERCNIEEDFYYVNISYNGQSSRSWYPCSSKNRVSKGHDGVFTKQFLTYRAAQSEANALNLRSIFQEFGSTWQDNQGYYFISVRTKSLQFSTNAEELDDALFGVIWESLEQANYVMSLFEVEQVFTARRWLDHGKSGRIPYFLHEQARLTEERMLAYAEN